MYTVVLRQFGLSHVVPKHHETGDCITVLYDRIVVLLVDAFQKKQMETEHLVNENKMLKEKLNTLETRFNNLLKVLNISYL